MKDVTDGARPVLWTPSKERVHATQMARFAQTHGYDPNDYEALWQWSTSDLGAFWGAVSEFCDVKWTRAPAATMGGGEMLNTSWFIDGELSFAANLLRSPDGAVAIVAVDESGDTTMVSRAELHTQVAAFRGALIERGVAAGDRVAALMPNRTETVVALLAADSLGAIFSSCSPDFGAGGVVDRFGQINPTILITADGYRYNGSTFPLAEKLDAIITGLDRLERLIVVNVIDEPVTSAHATVERWDDLIQTEAESSLPGRPFADPLAILYSSGTTGAPKSIIHSAGGTLIKHLSEQRLHCDIGPGDVAMWFTTCGWMMWNWLVSALASGATIVLYDGSPSHPDLGTLWRVAQQAGVTHFGTSPKFLAACAGADIVPREVADLGTVRAVMSTGSPLGPAQFDWVYEYVADDLQLASVSGGTDLIGCFAAGVPTLPVRRGELQGRALGMAVEAWDTHGHAVLDQKGELVCTKPFPSMPLGFWGDEDDRRYHDAYFAEHAGVWTHGDFIEVTSSGGVIIYGRSDTTLNPGGVRIGTAELYRALDPMPEVADAVVVGRPVDDDVEVVLFVVLADDVALDDALREEIRARVRQETTPRHVPQHVIQVADIPYTISGKKVEKAVLLTITGQPVGNLDALANPAALKEYARLTVDGNERAGRT